MEPDEKFMRFALELARRGVGKTSPNPMVGAVLVKGGEVIGAGFHEKAGAPHAEAAALLDAGEKARGAVLYVNLEPCAHYGRTPPCTEAIINAGIKKVVISMTDPNPLVCGEGIRRLREAGLEVLSGLLEDEARRLNEAFIKYITTGKPFLMLKAAMTLDGKIAAKSGNSKWISGESSRSFAHELRSISDGVIVGIDTVLQDDPLLDVRLEGFYRNPARIIADSRGRLPLESRIVKTAAGIKTILATTEQADKAKLAALESAGVEIIRFPAKNGRVDLQALIQRLGEMEMSLLLSEGGGSLNYSFLAENLADKIHFFIAPKLFGGKDAPTPLQGEGITDPDEAWLVEDIEIKQFDQDLLITGYPVKDSGQ